jgi:hypothetical protein
VGQGAEASAGAAGEASEAVALEAAGAEGGPLVAPEGEGSVAGGGSEGGTGTDWLREEMSVSGQTRAMLSVRGKFCSFVNRRARTTRGWLCSLSPIGEKCRKLQAVSSV